MCTIARSLCVGAVAGAVVLSACAPALRSVPAGPWLPDEGGLRAFSDATRSCRGARTMTAELTIRGRVAGERIRGRLVVGLERPGRLRIEAPAPFGAPVFILVASGERAVLVLPRDRAVVRDASVRDILAALAGIDRTADDLLGLLTGCLVDRPTAVTVSAGPSGWWRADLEHGSTGYIRRTGASWQIRRGSLVAEGMAGWTVDYADWTGAFPGSIRLMAGQPGEGSGTELTLAVTQREMNVEVPAAAFAVTVPSGYESLGIEALRTRRTLGEDVTEPRRRP